VDLVAALENLLANLNPPQREAVMHTEGPLLILAGAGSGKTRVITTRIAYLIKAREVWPSNILAITFTNKAASEMRERVERLLGDQVGAMWISTFHAACVRILRREILNLGYGSNFIIYDTADQQAVIKACLKELNLDEKKFPPRAIAGAISNAKNKLLTPEKFALAAEDYFQEMAAKVYPLYQKKLRENNGVDFDDLLMLTVRLFQEQSGVLSYYQQKFRYIMVDEYQDTNHAQYLLVNLLAEQHQNICVVGDDDQSIYKFRGADIRNMVDFERDYPAAKVIKLEQNYRSTESILQAANQVVQNNPCRKEKALWTDRGQGEKIGYYQGFDEQEEARFVAQQIQEWAVKQGGSYSEVAVLYRTNVQSRAFEEWFRRLDIPYQIIGGLGFYERKEIKDVMAYLRVLANPDDRVAFERVINVPKRGVGEASLTKLMAVLPEFNNSLAAGLANLAAIPGIPGKAKEGLLTFQQMMAKLREDLPALTISEMVQEILEVSGYWFELKNSKDPQDQGRLENIQEFLSVTKDYDRTNPQGSLEDFLSGLALYTDLDGVDKETSNVVMLMTLHTAKGLEFPLVFLVGLEEGVFPHIRSLEEPDELEEERRLCYVGITRAMDKLFLTHAQSRMLYGRWNSYLPSRFLKEVPEELLAGSEQKNKSAISSGNPWKSSFKVPVEAGEPNFYQLGEKVAHPKWGEGAVVSVKGSGGDAQITVAFPGEGIKTLIAKYAPLKKVT
jgi:DNA helicase-2/ATP-dependent DNA helicase PcrA